MEMPKEEKPRLLTRAQLMEYPIPEKGWRVLEDTITEGVNPVTGSPYLRYTMVRDPVLKGKSGKRKRRCSSA